VRSILAIWEGRNSGSIVVAKSHGKIPLWRVKQNMDKAVSIFVGNNVSL
jgi:hypothetical protein